MASSLGHEPRFGIIGGSGVQVEGKDPWRVKTPFGDCVLVALDSDRRVIFANRHKCTSLGGSGTEASYAPPHVVNYQALVWALAVECKCAGIAALGSAGTLHPTRIPVGSVVVADDYYMVRPEPVTFWGHEQVGAFDVPGGGVGRVHYTPADAMDQAALSFRARVQGILKALLPALGEKVKLAHGQTPDLWPCVHSHQPGSSMEDSTVYVNTIGPRFETRAEIRAYQAAGHVVGMTCAREWMLCEEVGVPYCLICFCDNACNGLSTHPSGALQEYLDHKQSITDVTTRVVEQLVNMLPQPEPSVP